MAILITSTDNIRSVLSGITKGQSILRRQFTLLKAINNLIQFKLYLIFLSVDLAL